MKIDSDNTFIIKGINMKGEIIMGLIMVMVILITVIVGISIIILTNSKYSFRNPPFFLFLFLLFLGVGFALLSGKFIGKKLSWLWYIRIQEEGIYILEKKKKHFLSFNNFEGMYVGTPNMRFLSIKSGERIRIRVGVGGYAPYSSENDIETMDEFIKNLKIILIEKKIDVKGGKSNNIITYHFIKK